MNFKKISLLILILLIADQLLKIWVKTHMHLDESIIVFPDWFQLRFIENNGAAFGMHIASKGGFDWGKLLLGIFRIVMVGLIGWLMHHLLRRREDTPKGVIVGLALVMAGALGNIVAQMHLPAQRFEPFGQLPDLRPMCVGLFGAVPDCLCAQRILQYPAFGGQFSDIHLLFLFV